MKNILNIKRGGAIALAILSFAVSALGQMPTYSPTTVGGLPATLAAVTQTNFPAGSRPFIDASKQQTVAFMMYNSWSTAGESTGNTNALYILAPSIDGVIADTNKTVTLASYNRAATAGVPSPSSTNLSANGIKGWFIMSQTNGSAAGVLTNGTGSSAALTYSTKISAP